MKILQLIHSRHFAGSERAVATLSKELVKKGHVVVIGVKSGGSLADRLRAEGFEVVEIPRFAWAFPFWLTSWVRTNGIELIHSHLTGAARIAEKVSRSVPLGLVVHLHILKKAPVFQRACRNGILVGVSEFTSNWHLEHLELPREKVVTIHNSMEVPNNELPVEQRADVRKKLLEEFGLKEAHRIIVLPGRVSPGKGHRVVLEAMAEVRKRFPEVRLLLVGDLSKKPTYVQELSIRRKQLRLSNEVIFTGFRRDIADFLQLADLVVIPSVAEPFGLVVIEAMISGVPLMAANAGGIPEILEGGRWGTLISSRKPAVWAEAIAQFLAQSDTALSRAHEAKTTAIERFNVALMTQRIEAIYAKALELKAG